MKDIFKETDQSYEDSDKVQKCIEQIDKIKTSYSDVVKNNEDAYDYYFGKNYMQDIDGRSKVYTKDTFDTIEWIMPSLLKIFAGGDEVTTLSPRKAQDADQVQRHNELINYQMKIKNPWFVVINDWFKDALLLKRGAVKYQWHKETEERTNPFEDATEQELQAYVDDPDVVEITDLKEEEISPESTALVPDMYGMMQPTTIPAVKKYSGKIHYKFEEEYPIVEAVPVHEFGMPLETRDIDNCKFLYHETRYSKWDFIDAFGQPAFEKVKDQGSFMEAAPDLNLKQKMFTDVNGANIYFYDSTDDSWIVYECYFRNEDNGKPWRRVICGNVLLEDKENEYGKPPFEIITPIKLSHRLIGLSVFDCVMHLQKIRTSLLRQMLDSGFFDVNGRWLIDPTRIDYFEVKNNNYPGGIMRTLDGNPADESAVRQIQGQGLPAFSFDLYETILKERDYTSGVPRASQGVNDDVLNKTMRGQNQQVQLAQQRIEMIARLFSEMGVGPLIRDIADMNSRFMSKEQAVKVVDDWVPIKPEDVAAKADVIINVGLGTTNKDIIVSEQQQLQAIYAQLYPIFGQALNSPILHSLKELVKAMGYRDTQNYVPGEQELLQQQMMMQQQMMAQQAMKQGGQQPMNTQAPPQATQGMQPAQLPTPAMPGNGDMWQ